MWMELTMTIVACAFLVILVTLGLKYLNDYLLKRRYKYGEKNTNFKFRRREETTRDDKPVDIGVEQPRIQQLPEVISGTTEIRGNEDLKPEFQSVVQGTNKTLKKLKKS